MRFFKYMKDGGPESKSEGLFFVEIKKVFSIVLLRFSDGSRDAYHCHAFNAMSWILKGKLVEFSLDSKVKEYHPSIKPVYTPRTMFHKVISVGTTWAITFRGPWAETWREYLPQQKKFVTLTHGRKIIET